MRSRAPDNVMKLYRLLLHLYPSSYRAEYGDEMSAIFARELRRSGGSLVRCGLWLAALIEVFSNAAAVHWEIARRDLRSSIRSLCKSPGFALTAILLVTIGIGATEGINRHARGPHGNNYARQRLARILVRNSSCEDTSRLKIQSEARGRSHHHASFMFFKLLFASRNIKIATRKMVREDL